MEMEPAHLPEVGSLVLAGFIEEVAVSRAMRIS